ncbi:exo-beta-N-acetylmuramidase NamZ family protein [Agromyces archimandritae]|uniref:DUF1343 domain-containing protein n=1 Tax=Agromyces archimandritae TaxID=2781962 RepID=A0A975FN57_9MICO|nr:DUF1343 domain-containing protein [Agromyces archimandritae]QTX04081.1 DUF1343 domain-containing protein [Agromyces archimandritae]
MHVRTGLERLLADPDLVPGRRWGMLTNYTATTTDLEFAPAAIRRVTDRLVALLGPEHGVRGAVQAGFSEQTAVDDETGLPIADTYRHVGADLDRLIASHDLDVIVADLQDVGTRFYTYAWSVIDCMRSAARLGIPFVVLDRPNPIGGGAAGPGLVPECASFVGREDIPIRHGMTLGELAREIAARDAASGNPSDVTVIEMRRWRHRMTWADTGLPWVMPSPNMPTPDTARAFPCTGLFEGTNLSEGRGTTRPFELVGAPWLPVTFADELNARELPGVRFRRADFTPTFSKHAGEHCVAVQVHVTDHGAFEPVRTGVSMLHALHERCPDEFAWLQPGRGQPATRFFVDLLWGSEQLRTGLADGASVDDVLVRSPLAAANLTGPLYPA